MVACHDAIKEVMAEAGGVLSAREIIGRLYEKHPSKTWKESTIYAHLYGCSVNNPPAYTQHRYFPKFLFDHRKRNYELYDEGKHSKWSRGYRIGKERLDPHVEQRTALVIRPEEPFSNLVRLRRILRESEGFIWWADMHFHARALEELIVSVDPTRVRQVRILSGPANVDERAKGDFARFRIEMERKGIEAEWRVLPRFAHDRFIITKNACFNVPPVNSILQGAYGEILETPNRPPFDDWWTGAKDANPLQ